MTPDPTAEARAAALVEKWIKAPAEKPRPDFHGTSRYDATTCMFMIDECKKAPLRRLIALALDTFRKEGVERAEKERDAAYAIRDAGWEQTEGVIKERDALRARLSPERLEKVADAIVEALMGSLRPAPSMTAVILAVLQRELGKE